MEPQIESTNSTRTPKADRLSVRDVPLLVGIIYRTSKVQSLQNRVPIPRLLEAFETTPRETPDGETRLAHVRWLTDGILHRLFGGAYCIKRTLILFHYARRFGLEPRVVFGVAREGDGLKGHAWLELHGHPYKENEGAVEEYKVIYSHPPK